MYGFSTRRLAASTTRFTRRGADAGAITRPSTSVASSGGGGGGSNVAPPLLFDRPADAGAARLMRSSSAAATAAQSSVMWLRDDGILFRTPAGLADGLALKELARLPGKEVRPSGFRHLGSPAPRMRGFGVAGKVADVFLMFRCVFTGSGSRT